MIANTSAATKTTEPESVRRSHIWAWLASALAIVLVLTDWAFTIYLSVIAHAGPYVPQPANDLEWFAGNVVWGMLFPLSWLSFAIVGTIILSRRPDNKIGWLCLALGAFGASEDLPWRLARMVAAPVMAGVLSLMASVFYALYLPMTLTLLLLHFPTGRYLSPQWRSVGLVAIGCAAMSIFAAFIRPVAWVGEAGEVPNLSNPFFLWPEGLAPFISTFSWTLVQSADRVGLIALGAAVVSLVVRWRSTDAVERQQLKWLTLACMVSIVFTVLGFATNQLTPFTLAMGTLALVGFGIGVPVAIGIAILRHGLFDIDVVINRALVYGTLTAMVVILYVLIVGGLSTVFQSSGNLLIAIIATGLIAVLFNPLRTRVQRVVNRALYGERDEPTVVLSRLGQQLESATVPYTALKSIVDSVAQALKLPYVEIALKDGDTFKTVATCDRVTRGRDGGRGGNSRSFSPDRLVPLSLIHQGETLGEMRVAPRTPGEVFSSQDMALLQNIAHQAGATAHAALLMRDLQHSRESLVTAREEERRRLRRDLHDGLGPTLASQTLKLDAAMDLMEANPYAARELLNQLKRQTQTTVADVRRLVYELRPPTLDEQGLVGAIRNFAASINGLEVTVDAPDTLPPLSAAVEVAAYRIVTEAITNVIKHAKASRCNVTIGVLKDVETHPSTGTGDVSLHITIVDDGIGIAPPHTSGVGLRSMRERAEELGGALAVESSGIGALGAGVKVTAELPIERPI